MEKKQKSKSHQQRKREKSRDQGKESWTELLYEDDGYKELRADLVCKGEQGKELRTDLACKGEGLPADVVYEILVRLPAKSLIKFRGVCKQWFSLISHRSFQQNHYRVLSRQDPLLLITKKKINKSGRTNFLSFYTHDINKETLVCNVLRFYIHDINEETLVSKFSETLPLLPNYTDILLVQTCQGFLCFVDHYYKKYIFLCNPSTREFITIPLTNERNDCVAFGFAESTKEFKLVRFFSRNGTKTLCEVFTLDTNKWIEARCPPLQNQRFGPCAYFLHGAIHLEPLGKGPIHAFNIETEEYRLISLPEICQSHYNQFGELAGFLYLTMCTDRGCEIWLLKDYYNGTWMKEYTIDDSYFGTPSVILGDGSLLLLTFPFAFDESDGWLSSYNPHHGTYTRKLVYLPEQKATLYVGSLFSLCR